jgi:hypothetical protein
MAIFDTNGRSLLVGALIGGAALALTRGVPSAVAEVARPLAKSAIRLGMSGAERALELYGRLTETVEDLAAEVAAERPELTAVDRVAAEEVAATVPVAAPPRADRGGPAGGDGDEPVGRPMSARGKRAPVRGSTVPSSRAGAEPVPAAAPARRRRPKP